MSETVFDYISIIGLSGAAADELRMVEEVMRGAGVTPESLRAAADEKAANPTASEFGPLTDAEWQALSSLVPAEASQSRSMGNRDFLDAVLNAMRHGGRWTEHPNKGRYSDAVRRRFGRWAHQGIWRRLAVDSMVAPLSEERKAELVSIARRAERLASPG